MLYVLETDQKKVFQLTQEELEAGKKVKQEREKKLRLIFGAVANFQSKNHIEDSELKSKDPKLSNIVKNNRRFNSISQQKTLYSQVFKREKTLNNQQSEEENQEIEIQSALPIIGMKSKTFKLKLKNQQPLSLYQKQNNLNSQQEEKYQILSEYNEDDGSQDSDRKEESSLSPLKYQDKTQEKEVQRQVNK